MAVDEFGSDATPQLTWNIPRPKQISEQVQVSLSDRTRQVSLEGWWAGCADLAGNGYRSMQPLSRGGSRLVLF